MNEDSEFLNRGYCFSLPLVCDTVHLVRRRASCLYKIATYSQRFSTGAKEGRIWRAYLWL